MEAARKCKGNAPWRGKAGDVIKGHTACPPFDAKVAKTLSPHAFVVVNRAALPIISFVVETVSLEPGATAEGTTTHS